MKDPINTIGIVDDDKVYQLIMKRLIQQTGLVSNILQFLDGEEAFNFFSARTDRSIELPQIILLDINMPYMNGWQFLDSFTTLSLNATYLPKIYMASSSNNDDDLNKAKEYDIVTGYLVKPITQAQFIQLIS